MLNQNYAGCSFEEIRRRIHNELKELRESMSQLMAAALEVGSQAMHDASDEVVISGERNLLQVHDLSGNMASLRKLFDLFEQKTSLLQLLDVSSRAHGVQIFIGGGTRVGPPAAGSLLPAPP